MLIRRSKSCKTTFFLDMDVQDFNYKQKPNTSNQTMRNSIISSESSTSSSDSVGLRILIDARYTSPRESNNTILFKLSVVASTYSQEPSFLKACCLCKKKLSPGKNVYMYMGDQGFCSEDCRSRQIVRDEIMEIELSTKKILASSPHCPKNVRIRLPSHRNRIPAAS